MPQTTPISKSSSTPTPTSPTPTGRSPLEPILRRHAVRPTTGVTLTAVPVVRPEVVSLPDGTVRTGRPGEWLITRGNTVVDLISSAELRTKYEPTERDGVLIRGEDRTRLERTLGVGSTQTPDHLVTAVDRIARLKIGDIRVEFTPGQWEHLKHRAEKMRLTVGELVQRIVHKICQDIWQV